MAVTFNSVPMFFPLPINKLFTCQKYNDDHSQTSEMSEG